MNTVDLDVASAFAVESHVSAAAQTSSGPTESVEYIYGLILAEKWGAVLDFIHSGWKKDASEIQFNRVVETFLKSFFETLPRQNRHEKPFSDRTQAALAERLLLFQLSGQFQISPFQFRDLVLRLVIYYSETPSKALSLAQFLPDDPTCSALIEKFGTPRKNQIRDVAASNVTVVAVRNAAAARPPNQLFRSEQERRFFEALVEVFSHHLVYPNVAVQSVVGFEHIQASLSGREKEYFFRSLIDDVVFDARNGYRAIAAFELDSPLHDDVDRKEKDGMKDRILAQAGIPLVRIRPHNASMTREAFCQQLARMKSEKEIPGLE